MAAPTRRIGCAARTARIGAVAARPALRKGWPAFRRVDVGRAAVCGEAQLRDVQAATGMVAAVGAAAGASRVQVSAVGAVGGASAWLVQENTIVAKPIRARDNRIGRMKRSP
jgi:hypothetical protein